VGDGAGKGRREGRTRIVAVGQVLEANCLMA
jgi:hypothetical protein